MEIEVGEYVRLARNQGINRIIEIEDKRYILDTDIADEFGDNTCVLEEYQLKDEVLDHNKNIIDLVEVGDIVHIKDVLHEDITYIWSEDYLKALKEDIQNGIKLVSILTKEQMQSIEYKVEEDR
jgi:hypothetical protein